MKTIIISNEQWFKLASFNDVKMFAIKFLEIPADKFTTKQTERFKRALVRQVFAEKGTYGKQYELQELSNVFGAPRRKRSKNKQIPSGTYTYVTSKLRCRQLDVRHEMMAILSRHTKFEDAIAEFEKKYGKETKFKTTGMLRFDFIGLIHWALSHDWIKQDDLY